MCDRTVNVKRIRNITRSDSFIVSMDVLQKTTYHAATEQLEIFGQSKSFRLRAGRGWYRRGWLLLHVVRHDKSPSRGRRGAVEISTATQRGPGQPPIQLLRHETRSFCRYICVSLWNQVLSFVWSSTRETQVGPTTSGRIKQTHYRN